MSPACSPTWLGSQAGASSSIRGRPRELTPYFLVFAKSWSDAADVEKFIGDAVMAVFGAPTAHEDDPERAVRAAFAIREALAEMNEQVRSSTCTCVSGATRVRPFSLGASPSMVKAWRQGTW